MNLLLLLMLLAFGSLGYHLIEGWPLLDSIFMTVNTLATVGFREENPLTPDGKLFTIGLIYISLYHTKRR
jgi:voltage-gated potassium channel